MQENNNAFEVRTDEETVGKQTVVGVRFRPCGKIYTFAADDDMDLFHGTRVVVESEMGVSIGSVATLKYAIEKPEEPLKKVIRLANEKDFETARDNRAFQDEARAFCVNRVKELNLAMKIITTETTLDRKRLIFYFTADGRIDFRELVRDLAAKFKTRIEMRQIGVRDEVKLLGGIGVCGRQTCCNLFLTNFEPVTIKMAKRQDLSINQSKLSGICGRLMCCLGYECKEPTGEKAAADAREEEIVSVLEEPSEIQQGMDSGTVLAAVAEMQNEQSSTEEGKPAGQQHAEHQRKEQTPADRDMQRRRRSRRNRHRHRRHMSEKPANEKPLQEGAAQKPEGEEKGKAFSRRRKFWRKKKH